MKAVDSPEALARLLYRYVLQPWLEARPGTAVDTPVFGGGGVDFTLRGPGGPFGFRVDGSPAGLRVQPWDGTVDRVSLGELTRLIGALSDRGLGLSPRAAVARRVELFIASGCNLACRFCCEADRIERQEFMSWSDIDARLENAAADGVQVIQFMGGEATLHPRFPDALRRAKALGLGTYVITNLLRWEDRAFAEAVAPWLDEVMVSVHAHDAASGAIVTQRPRWFERFSVAAVNARETLGPRRRASTVLTRHNVDHLDAIAGIVLSFAPQVWIFGTPVPVRSSAERSLADALSLTEHRDLGAAFQALSDRAAASDCRLVFFSLPHCSLPAALRDQTHDTFLDHQDLGVGATAEPSHVNFWSEADYLSASTAVALGRRRGAGCVACERNTRCGGHYGAYLDRHGESELWPVRDGVASPA